jgi:glycosyltransferase involved in cell wall biosynthesis
MKQNILIRGPVLSQSGYGEQARFAMRAIRSKEDLFNIFILPLNWGQTGWVSLDNQERNWIDERIKATHLYTQQGGTFDISLQVTIPNEFERIAPVNIGYTAGIETTKVSSAWLNKVNEMDKIIVVSNHSKDVFKDTVYTAQHPTTGHSIKLECNSPIEVVNYPVRDFKKQKINLNLDYDFNYLAISQWGPRKNFDNLINWFIEENADKEVGLVLKTSIKNNSLTDREFTENKLKSIIAAHGDIKCKVYLLHGDLTEEELTGVYQDKKIKCLISTTHGEGYGLPLFEAAYNGLPVICVGWSGQKDFLYVPQKSGKLKPMFTEVAYELKSVQPEAVWNGVIEKDSQWAFPKEESFKKALREVRSENSRCRRNASKLKKYLRENFTEDKMYSQFVDHVTSFGEENESEIIL